MLSIIFRGNRVFLDRICTNTTQDMFVLLILTTCHMNNERKKNEKKIAKSFLTILRFDFNSTDSSTCLNIGYSQLGSLIDRIMLFALKYIIYIALAFGSL